MASDSDVRPDDLPPESPGDSSADSPNDSSSDTPNQTPDPSPPDSDSPAESEPLESEEEIEETEEPAEPEDPLSKWIAALQSDTLSQQLDALKHLQAESETIEPTPELLRAVERCVAQTQVEAVRSAGLALLNDPAYRAAYRAENTQSAYWRKTIAGEIDRWQSTGLLEDWRAKLLTARYRFDVQASPAVAEEEAPEPEEPRTMMETLLSENTIKMVLALGVFFIVSAACFFALILEELRLPILTLGVLGFSGGAIGLKKRLPQASFSFAIIASFLIPIDALVLTDQLGLSNTASYGVMALTFALLTGLWAGATWFYRSRFFSGVTVLAASTSAFFLSRALDAEWFLDMGLVTLVSLAGLGAVHWLKQWQDWKFARPLFWLIQAQQVIVLGVLAVFAIIETPDGLWAAVALLTLLAAALFYELSRHLSLPAVFPAFTVAVLLPVPILFGWATGLGDGDSWPLALFIWGLALTLSSELWRRISRWQIQRNEPYFLLGGAVLLALGSAGMWAENQHWLSLMFLSGAALLYGGLTALAPRASVWTGTLVAGTLAYLTIYNLPQLDGLWFHPGYNFWWAGLILLSLALVLSRFRQKGAEWWGPPLGVGLVCAGFSVLAGLWVALDEPLGTTILFILWGFFALAYGLLDRRVWLIYVTTAAFSLALGVSIAANAGANTTWVLQFVALASVFYLAGLALHYASPAESLRAQWAGPTRFSGLALGTLVGFSAPLQNDVAAIAGVTLVAVYFTIEAFKQRNIWLGFPANFFYFIAYVLILLELEINQPQFYSIGAALLGLLMHYLLIRRQHRLPATITGVISQLILLGTSLVQIYSGLDDNAALIYFLVLFGQGLAVMVYGVVVRVRNFIILPPIFIVLGMFGTFFSVLVGPLALVLVTCAGFALLIGGVLALLMRERLLEASASLGERLGGWRG